MKRLKAEVSNITGELSGLQFSYNDPERGFERSRVKGLVARLVHVKDASTMTALEVRDLTVLCFVLEFDFLVAP